MSTGQAAGKASYTALTAEELRDLQSGQQFSQHFYNDKAMVSSVRLGEKAGLEHTAIRLCRAKQGHDSTALHTHRLTEEWVYILSGRGTLTLLQSGSDTPEERAVGPGDFHAFPRRSAAHKMTAAGGEDLVYLCGGEKSAPFDVCEYPEADKTLLIDYTTGERRDEWVPMSSLQKRD